MAASSSTSYVVRWYNRILSMALDNLINLAKLTLPSSLFFLLPSSIDTRSERKIPVYGTNGACASRCSLRRLPILFLVLKITFISSNRAICFAGTYDHACFSLCIGTEDNAPWNAHKDWKFLKANSSLETLMNFLIKRPLVFTSLANRMVAWTHLLILLNWSMRAQIFDAISYLFRFFQAWPKHSRFLMAAKYLKSNNVICSANRRLSTFTKSYLILVTTDCISESPWSFVGTDPCLAVCSRFFCERNDASWKSMV
mmetsp:Transcript_39418/g.63026  ORF Transcript_39418/g.63026 Transcript_39418/m.63026 type:complete len:256 (-) Transcript_39418:327-1094(-)